MSQPQPQIPEVGDEFPTVESFKEAAQEGAKAAGFAFSISSSKVSGGRKGGHTSYIILQCTMETILNEDTKVWIIKSSKTEHNYELLLLSQVHCLPQHRSLSTEQKELVHIMLKSDDTNRDTTVHFLQMLDKRQYIVRHVLTKDSHMLNLFFTHNKAARQVAICPDVLIVNATYKTNIYKLSLINTVSVSNVGDSKALNTYTIAMAWHMLAQNLRTACRKFFNSNEDYNELLLSIQKVAYAEKMNEVKKAFNEKNDAEYWIHIFIKNYPHMRIQSTQRAEGSHSALKKAIEAASDLEQAIDKIKNEVCEIGENKNTDNSPCDCSLRLNYKLPCRYIIPQTGPIPLALVHSCWYLKHDTILLLPPSLSTDFTITKILYKLEEKYENLNDSGSKATFLHKIEALASEEIVILKASLPNAPKKKHSTSTNPQHIQQPLFYDQIPAYMHEYIKEVININEDSNCGYKVVAMSNNDYDMIVKEISWESGPCTFEHWMRMPQIALAMAFVNENHYVALVLRPGTPVLPIVNRWSQFATLATIR
ncbi:14312_t:CDS:2 [Dentiscutata heterogama]|uniref:14312_t:CDS:1 n=1 Tax=Dentiscutata heterogama TaxID=1316150 RepID=A0ACA9MVT3_9GLOM|nr:14312_t:CDS:2 [Dentiscutata heterogama]